MKQKGNNFPANTGPVPSINCVSAGMCTSGRTHKSPIASSAMVPILMKADRTDLFAHDLAEALAAATHRADEHREVLNGAAENHADHDVERGRKVPELRREDRSDERSRAGDGGEMVTENDPAI